MSKKNRKRRETTRRQKEQRQAKAAAASESAEDGVEEAADDDAPQDEAATIRRRAEQKREYEKRKREKASGGQPLAPYFWGGGIAATIAVAVLGGFLLLGGGGDDGGSNPTPAPTIDPRIANLPIDRTITVETEDEGQDAGTQRFIPSTITGQAGEVIEILVTNVGSVAHNLTFPGTDGEYDTRDDWLVDPFTLQPGDTGRLVVQFPDPGSYQFRCSFHPLIHLGSLTLS